MSHLQKQALEFATNAHSGQSRSDGRPFIWHPIEVASMVKAHGYSSDEVVCAAYLHDTIEDTEVTYEDIHKAFGRKIADIVLELTNPMGDNEGERHERNLANAKHIRDGQLIESLIIKCADRACNLRDISYMRTPAWFKSFTSRTKEYLIPALDSRGAAYNCSNIYATLVHQVNFNTEIISYLDK